MVVVCGEAFGDEKKLKKVLKTTPDFRSFEGCGMWPFFITQSTVVHRSRVLHGVWWCERNPQTSTHLMLSFGVLPTFSLGRVFYFLFFPDSAVPDALEVNATMQQGDHTPFGRWSATAPAAPEDLVALKRLAWS